MSTVATNPEPSRFERIWNSNMAYSFRRNPVAVVSLAIFLAIAIMSLLAPVIAPFDPYDPAQIDIMNSEYPPVWVDGSEPEFIWAPMIKDAIFGRRSFMEPVCRCSLAYVPLVCRRSWASRSA